MDKQLHLLRHRLGDLFLDTFVVRSLLCVNGLIDRLTRSVLFSLQYGAHSTATDALYAGLPVLTLAGDSFAR